MYRKIKILIIIIITISSLLFVALQFNLPEAPIFELPVENINDVMGIQTYNSPSHTGFDFVFEKNTKIYSPIEGLITDVNKHQMTQYNDYWIVDVNIRINSEWSMFIAFEPSCKPDEEWKIDQQLSMITVKEGDRVIRGQEIGTLLYGGTFSHIHWQVMYKEDSVKPYDYCSDDAKSQMDTLYEKFPGR